MQGGHRLETVIEDAKQLLFLVCSFSFSEVCITVHANDKTTVCCMSLPLHHHGYIHHASCQCVWSLHPTHSLSIKATVPLPAQVTNGLFIHTVGVLCAGFCYGTTLVVCAGTRREVTRTCVLNDAMLVSRKLALTGSQFITLFIWLLRNVP